MKPYYILAIKESDKWVVAFGDYVKQCVKEEREDYFCSGTTLRKNMRIVKLDNDEQATIDAQIDFMNNYNVAEAEPKPILDKYTQQSFDRAVAENREKALCDSSVGRDMAFNRLLGAREFVAFYEGVESTNYQAVDAVIKEHLAYERKLAAEEDERIEQMIAARLND